MSRNVKFALLFKKIRRICYYSYELLPRFLVVCQANGSPKWHLLDGLASYSHEAYFEEEGAKSGLETNQSDVVTCTKSFPSPSFTLHRRMNILSKVEYEMKTLWKRKRLSSNSCSLHSKHQHCRRPCFFPVSVTWCFFVIFALNHVWMSIYSYSRIRSEIIWWPHVGAQAWLEAAVRFSYTLRKLHDC